MNDYQTKTQAKKELKRYGICLLVSLPILIVVGIFLKDINRVARVFIFIAIMLLVFVLCEMFFKSKDKKKTDKLKTDVFK